MHAVEDEHDTPNRLLAADPVGLGTDWTVHSMPFQRSAKAKSMCELFWYSPTATHEVADVHDTRVSRLESAPVGLGGASTVHVVPFQRSASGTPAPELLVYVPTAVHSL